MLYQHTFCSQQFQSNGYYQCSTCVQQAYMCLCSLVHRYHVSQLGSCCDVTEAAVFTLSSEEYVGVHCTKFCSENASAAEEYQG
jgi:hypothetical protein